MRGMTKAQCLQFEKLTKKMLCEILGDFEDVFGDGRFLKWKMAYGETGQVHIELICDSVLSDRTHRNSWIACRIKDEQRLVGEDGYKKPQNQIKGGWPWPFTYPSGKCNLTTSRYWTESDMRAELVLHFTVISEFGSELRNKFQNYMF